MSELTASMRLIRARSNTRARDGFGLPAIRQAARKAGGSGEPLRQHARPGGALDAPVPAKHEENRQRDVHAVQQRLEEEAGRRLAAADDPAEHHVVDQHEGRRPDAHKKIREARFGHLSDTPIAEMPSAASGLAAGRAAARPRARRPARGRAPTAARPRRATAWAVRPVVEPRRKLKVAKRTSKMTAAMATPPINAASPSWPMTAVPTTPTSGVER